MKRYNIDYIIVSDNKIINALLKLKIISNAGVKDKIEENILRSKQKNNEKIGFYAGDDGDELYSITNAKNEEAKALIKLNDITQKNNRHCNNILLFMYILSETKRIKKGNAEATEIIINFNDLIYNGFYSTSQKAIESLDLDKNKELKSLLLKTEIEGHITTSNGNNKIYAKEWANLFTSVKIVQLEGYATGHRQLIIGLNNNINYDILFSKYYILPYNKDLAKLSEKALYLYLYLISIIRSNSNRSKKVSIKTITQVLLLPQNIIKNPGRDIIEPICKALDQINNITDPVIYIEYEKKPKYEDFRKSNITIYPSKNYEEFKIKHKEKNKKI